ncbi:unnamed protein product, partial [Symbiodinium pilosum]
PPTCPSRERTAGASAGRCPGGERPAGRLRRLRRLRCQGRKHFSQRSVYTGCLETLDSVNHRKIPVSATVPPTALQGAG